MAMAAENYNPYPRRNSTSPPSMLALLLASAAPLAVEPFHNVSPSFTYHVPSSLSAPSSHPLSAAKLHRCVGGCRRRGLLYLSSIDGGIGDDSDDESSGEKQMPSDDAALFSDPADVGDELTLSDSRLIFGDDDDDEEEDDPYAQNARSEFSEDKTDTIEMPASTSTSLATALARQSRELNTSPLDWGGALSTLRSRVSDIESGKSINPSTALFRTITRERPNEAIGRFIREANPEVVAAMTGAVSSLLGSLSNPAMGVEMIVNASTEKIGSLCFQLMMTGYMFRNAEYVLALKSLMNIDGEGATLEDYRAAFNRVDTDGSGYLERDEIEAMLADVYEGQPPAFEITTFLEYFDSNNDGRVSWEEFEKGFNVATKFNDKKEQMQKNSGFRLPGSVDEDEEEDDLFGEPSVSGTIKVELEDGRVIEVDAQEYMDDLKEQALELKRELASEKGIDPKSLGIPGDDAAAPGNSFVNQAVPGPDSSGGIASYIASLEGDVKSLTQGISPEVVDAMKELIDFVLEGGPDGGSSNPRMADKKKEMEMPGSALQQLALWQLVIGYRLRETEATGEWRQMLE